MSTIRRKENQLSIRKKGKFWQVRGTFKKLGQTRRVNEHSTGESREALAWRYVDRYEQRLEYEIVHGIKPPDEKLRFCEGVALYLEAETPNSVDASTLRALLRYFGEDPMVSIDQTRFNEYLRDRMKGRASSTQQRHASVFNRIYNYVDGHNIEPPNVRVKRKHKRRVRWLPIAQADALCEAYAAHAKPIAYTLRYTGMRTQEALQMQIEHVDLVAGTIWIPPSKNGESRTVEMNSHLIEILRPLVERDTPVFMREDGERTHPVFLTDKGKPYPDTRGKGGNPMKRAHNTARVKANITDFTPHDWRHHWACWSMHDGKTIAWLMNRGGWNNANMVMVYADEIPKSGTLPISGTKHEFGKNLGSGEIETSQIIERLTKNAS